MLDTDRRRPPELKCTVLRRQKELWELSQLWDIATHPQNAQERCTDGLQSFLGAYAAPDFGFAGMVGSTANRLQIRGVSLKTARLLRASARRVYEERPERMLIAGRFQHLCTPGWA